MVPTRPRCVPQPASAAFQRPVPNLGPVLHSFHPDLQDDEASTKGSLAFARPSFSSPVAPGRNEDPSACTLGSAPRSHPRRTPRRRPAIEQEPGITSPSRNLLRRDPLTTCDLVSHAQRLPVA